MVYLASRSISCFWSLEVVCFSFVGFSPVMFLPETNLKETYFLQDLESLLLWLSTEEERRAASERLFPAERSERGLEPV